MKKQIAGILALIGIAAFAYLWLPQGEVVVSAVEKDGPGHPGWEEQWATLKLGQDAAEAIAYWKQGLAEARVLLQRQRAQRTPGVLSEIREIGPFNVGGRTRALVIDWSNPTRYIAGGISGGLWESVNSGNSWRPVDDDAGNLTVTFLTQSPFDAAVWYYSTGEPTGNSTGIPGDGIYKSVDGAQSFYKLPASDTSVFDYNWRIVHSLVDSHTVFVATRSNGLWVSRDGGDSFEQLFSSGTAAINDIEVFRDSSLLITVHGQGVYHSPNGMPGTFTAMNNGLPATGQYRRVEIDYCDSFPQYVYAALENTSSNGLQGFYRSADGGQSWVEMANPDDEYGFNFPWYCLAVGVAPDDSNTVICNSVGSGFSNTGGAGWEQTEYSHADHHIVVFDPINPGDYLTGNDGGVYRYNLSSHKFLVRDLNQGYNVTQFYTGAFFPEGARMYGGTQDNGTQASRNGRPNFDHIFGGDGSFTQVKQEDPYTSYISWQNGNIYRGDDSYLDFPSYYPIKNELDGNGDGNIDDGSWFINPFDINPLDGEQVYFVTRRRLWRTVLGGIEWQPITRDMVTLSANPYCVGISHDLSPTVYVGGGEGLFYRIDNADTASAGDEVNLSASVPDSVTNDFIVNITVHPQFDSVVYVAFSNFAPRPRLYKVVAANTAQPEWINISDNLPKNIPVNWVQVSPVNDSVIVAATDYGLYATADEGQTWTKEDAIPDVSIHMIRLRQTDGKLFIFTHGRGIWTAQLPGNWITSVPEKVQPSILTWFPNPATDYIQWAGGQPMTYQVYSVQGRVVAAGRAEQAVFVGNLPAGVYIVHSTFDDGSEAIGKFVRQ